MPAAQEPSLLLIGTDFRCSPLELREKVAYGAQDSEDLLVHLLARPGIAEAFLLSTCNRTEIYVQPRDEEEAYRAALELTFLRRVQEMEKPGRLYVKRNAEAARHLLGVASGLESMVLGEPEILGQIKQQSALAETVGASGPVIRRLLRSAGAAGARARKETAISSGAVSIGYAIVELARNIFSGMENCRVLLIGAGEIARSVARPLVERGARELKVANRGAERARQFQEEIRQAQILSFDERLAAVREAEVVVATTGADEPVLTRKQLKEAMKARPTSPLLVVDLGVPRNVEPSAGKIENLFLHTIDSLDNLIQRNLKRRKEEVPRVQEIIEEELDQFRAWFRNLEAEPVVAQIQKQAERIRQQEVEAALSHFPAETHADLERLTRSLVRKILHHPSAHLRGHHSQGEGSPRRDLSRLHLVRELFHLDEDRDERFKDEKDES
ncbi:MAG: glutamyl-tRNA reductase [Acidobacteriota bacterium]|jgi:glutamyl-tRNA reductase|nr:glutamyl-tRNA reductase [Acidobacteriota bacterium]